MEVHILEFVYPLFGVLTKLQSLLLDNYPELIHLSSSVLVLLLLSGIVFFRVVLQNPPVLLPIF